MYKKVHYKNISKLPDIVPFVTKLVPRLGSRFKRSCIVEVLKETKAHDYTTCSYSKRIYNMHKKNKAETSLTLSNLELFIAFKAAESINIGGPSSNTSLINSFACD